MQSSDLSCRYGSRGRGCSTPATDHLRRAAHRSTSTFHASVCTISFERPFFDSQTGWSTDFRQTLRKLPEVGMTVRIMIAPLLAQSSQTAKTEVNRTPIRALHAQSLHKVLKGSSWRHHFQPYIGTRRKSATTTR